MYLEVHAGQRTTGRVSHGDDWGAAGDSGAGNDDGTADDDADYGCMLVRVPWLSVGGRDMGRMGGQAGRGGDLYADGGWGIGGRQAAEDTQSNGSGATVGAADLWWAGGCDRGHR